MKTIIATDKAPAALGPYSQAVKVGNTLYLSGQIALDPATGELLNADIREETHQIFKNMKAVLEAAGANFDNIVKATVFITDMNDFAEVNSVYQEAFPSNPPARSCVAVKALPKGARVEIEAIAIIK